MVPAAGHELAAEDMVASLASHQAAEAAVQAAGQHTVNVGSPTVVKLDSRRSIATKRILVWLLFAGIFGLMPIFAVAIKEALSPGGFHIIGAIRNGDVFIVSAVLAAGALGELIAAASKGMNFFGAILAGFFTLAVFAGNTVAYVYAGAAPASTLVTASYWVFPVTLAASGICVWTAAY
jgi:hypothetical protein